MLTDHKPFVCAFSTNSNTYTPRQIHHLNYISQFMNDIHHIKGANNPVTDTLSRIEINALQANESDLLEFEEMARAQQDDPDLTKLRSSASLILITRRYTTATDKYDHSMRHIHGSTLPKHFHRTLFNSFLSFHIQESERHKSWSPHHSFCLARHQHWCQEVGKVLPTQS